MFQKTDKHKRRQISVSNVDYVTFDFEFEKFETKKLLELRLLDDQTRAKIL